ATYAYTHTYIHTHTHTHTHTLTHTHNLLSHCFAALHMYVAALFLSSHRRTHTRAHTHRHTNMRTRCTQTRPFIIDKRLCREHPMGYMVALSLSKSRSV